MEDMVERLSGYGADTLILASPSDQRRILSAFFRMGMLQRFKLRDPGYFLDRFPDDYLIIMKEKYFVDYDIAERMKLAICVMEKKTINFPGIIESIRHIADGLGQSGHLTPVEVKTGNIKKVVAINREYIDALPPGIQFESLYLDKPVFHDMTEYVSKSNYDMVLAAYNKIVSLLEQGIRPEKIRIQNARDIDEYQLDKFLGMSKIPCHSQRKRKLSSHPLIIRFLAGVPEHGILQAWRKVAESVDESDMTERIVMEKLLWILNHHSYAVLEKYPDLLNHEIKNMDYADSPRTHSIQISGSDFSFAGGDEYWLILNATDDNLPSGESDNDILSDSEKQKIGLPTSVEMNDYRQRQLWKLFMRMPNITLFRPNYDNGLQTRKVVLPPKQGIISFPSEAIRPEAAYSYELDRLRYAKYEYEYRTFGDTFREYWELKKVFPSGLKKYDPQFRQVSPALCDRLIGEGVSISPSSLSQFYTCPFQFLADHLLRIDPVRKNLSMYFGNLAHKVVENVYSDRPVDIDSAFERFKGDFPEDILYKKNLFDMFLKQDLEAIVEMLEKFRMDGSFKLVASEWKHGFKHPADRRFLINGKIDRVIEVKKGEISLVIVIDYKTGSKVFDEEEFDEGTNIQLPFYLLLFRNCFADANHVPAGFFIQHLPLGKVKQEDATEKLAELMRLNGRMLEDHTLFAALGGETWLKSIKLNQDGSFNRQGKRLLSSSEMETILTTMQKQIDEAIEQIKNGKFEIKPLPPRNNERLSRSCQYCPYAAICYLKSLNREDDVSDEGDDGE